MHHRRLHIHGIRFNAVLPRCVPHQIPYYAGRGRFSQGLDSQGGSGSSKEESTAVVKARGIAWVEAWKYQVSEEKNTARAVGSSIRRKTDSSSRRRLEAAAHFSWRNISHFPTRIGRRIPSFLPQPSGKRKYGTLSTTRPAPQAEDALHGMPQG